MGRIIGIQHRTKRTAAGEARPTRVALLDRNTNALTELTLETETDEYDFVLGLFPTGYRRVVEDEDLTKFPAHQIKMKTVDDVEIPYQVPSGYDGLQTDDQVAMFLGGSGDRLAYALANVGQSLGATVHRIPTFRSKDMRPGDDKSRDHVLLAELFRDQPQQFYQATPRELENIELRERYFQRQDAMRARIAFEQRLRSRTIGNIFIRPDGLYPQGSVEDQFARIKTNDVTVQGAITEEDAREKELRRMVRQTEIWLRVFEPIEGCGEVIAAGIIAGIGDIRRFTTAEEAAEYDQLDQRARLAEAQAGRNKYRDRDLGDAKNHFERNLKIRQLMIADGNTKSANLMQTAIECRKAMYELRQRGQGRFKAFCGVHLIQGWAECADCWQTFKIEDNDRDGQLTCPKCKSENVAKKGQFARRRAGVVANWHPDVRQALYQLGDQFNRRPKSAWGIRLRQEKALYRQRYPEKEKRGEKSRYSDGHIHRMATWRTLTRFVEELYGTWTWIERNARQETVVS